MNLNVIDIAPAEWPALSQGFRDLTFEQTRAYCEPAAARIGGHARFVAVRRGSEVLALAALRVRPLPGLRRGIIWLPSGPLFHRAGKPDCPDADITAILDALRRQLVEVEGNILRLRMSVLSPITPESAIPLAQAAGFAPTSRAPVYNTFILDCRQTEDEMMRALHGKWRNNLRFALKSNTLVEFVSDGSLAKRFDAVMNAVQDTKGFAPDINAAFHRACQAAEYPLETFIVSANGKDVAAGLMVVTGKNANYLFAGTNEGGREVRAGYRLTWAMMTRCRMLGLDTLDLGGVDQEANPEVATFKVRIGAPLVQAAGPFTATPGGLFTRGVHALESLRKRLKGRG